MIATSFWNDFTRSLATDLKDYVVDAMKVWVIIYLEFPEGYGEREAMEIQNAENRFAIIQTTMFASLMSVQSPLYLYTAEACYLQSCKNTSGKNLYCNDDRFDSYHRKGVFFAYQRIISRPSSDTTPLLTLAVFLF